MNTEKQKRKYERKLKSQLVDLLVESNENLNRLIDKHGSLAIKYNKSLDKLESYQNQIIDLKENIRNLEDELKTRCSESKLLRDNWHRAEENYSKLHFKFESKLETLSSGS